jgi:hypothetical protein
LKDEDVIKEKKAQHGRDGGTSNVFDIYQPN